MKKIVFVVSLICVVIGIVFMSIYGSAFTQYCAQCSEANFVYDTYGQIVVSRFMSGVIIFVVFGLTLLTDIIFLGKDYKKSHVTNISLKI